MYNYNNFLKWACFSIVDRSTQDDKRSKLHIIGLFENPVIIEDSFIKNLPNQDICKRYICHIDELATIEQFYNDIQDLKEKYNNKWIYHLDDIYYTVDEHNRYRTMFDLWIN